MSNRALDSDAFVGEMKKARGRKNPLSAAGLRSLRDEHARTIEAARRLAAEAFTLEHRLSDLVERSLRPHARRNRPDVGHGAAAKGLPKKDRVALRLTS